MLDWLVLNQFPMTYFYTHRLVHSLTREGAFYSSLVWRLTTGQAVEKERLEKSSALNGMPGHPLLPRFRNQSTRRGANIVRHRGGEQVQGNCVFQTQQGSFT